MRYHTWHTRTLLALIAVLAMALITAGLLPTVQWVHKPFPGFFVHENLTVGPFFLPTWSGSAAGLRSLDRINAVNGRAVSDRADFYAAVKNAPPGSVFHYDLLRKGRPVTLTIPSMELSLHDWLLTFGIYMIIGLAFLIIGAAPYYLRAASPAALPLCFMGLAVFVWFEVTFDFMTTGLLPKEFRLFALTLTPSAGVHLALLLRGEKSLWRARPGWLLGLYGSAALLAGISSATFFGRAEIWDHVFQVSYVYTCLGAIGFLGIVGSALRGEVADLDRSRLRVMFGGAVFGFFIPTLATVLTSSFGWGIPYNLALVPTVFFPLSVAYALVKYSLFDLGNTLKAALSRIALAALLLVIYAVLGFVLETFTGIYKNDPLVPLFFAVVVVLIFNPLLSSIEKLVDRYIYRQEYDGAEVQRSVSLFLRTLATPEALAEGFVRLVSKSIGIESVRVTYLTRESDQQIIAGEGITEERVNGILAAVHRLRERHFNGYPHGLSRTEISADPNLAESREPLGEVFDQFGAELLIPLVFERELRGFVALGIKTSRHEYSAEDLRLLGTLADQLALSLENGRLYGESLNAYRKAEAMNNRLLEMDRVKKEFVQNICHELRTPVSTIIGFSELLLDPNFQSDSQKMLRRLIDNAQGLSSLMDSLMNFSRMESGAASVQLETVKLKEIVGALDLMARRLIRERPVRFSSNVESGAETIQSDGQKLQQILVQLVTNAIKFTREGRVELTVSRGSWGKTLEISVADTGIGIKPEHQNIIFEEFRQLDGSSTRQHGGTGVGLALCQRLAAALGGNIRLSSEPGAGSVFTVSLPVDSAALAGRTGWDYRNAGPGIGFAAAGAR